MSIQPCIRATIFGIFAFSTSVALSQTLIVPQISDSTLMGYLNEAAADYKLVRPNIGAAFATPVNLAPLPCEVPRLDLLKMVDAVGLSDESEKKQREYRRSMRNLGPEYLKSAYHFENLEVRAIKAQCKNAKLDGDIELWATGTRVEDNIKFISTQKFLKRVSFKAIEGKPVSRLRTWIRGGSEAKFVDPQMAEVMKNSKGPKVVDAWHLLYRDFDVESPAVIFTFVEMAGPASISESINTHKSLPNGGQEVSRYEQGQLASTKQYKNGDGHGLMVFYPTEKSNLKEKIVTCLRNGEIYMADPCDVD